MLKLSATLPSVDHLNLENPRKERLIIPANLTGGSGV